MSKFYLFLAEGTNCLLVEPVADARCVEIVARVATQRANLTLLVHKLIHADRAEIEAGVFSRVEVLKWKTLDGPDPCIIDVNFAFGCPYDGEEQEGWREDEDVDRAAPHH